MNINDRRKVEEHLGPMLGNLHIHTAQLPQLVPITERTKRRARWTKRVERTKRTVAATEKHLSNTHHFAQKVITNPSHKHALWLIEATLASHHAMWEMHLFRHSFLLWESSSLSCLTSWVHVLLLRAMCRARWWGWGVSVFLSTLWELKTKGLEQGKKEGRYLTSGKY